MNTPDYPSDILDATRMNRTLRHRIRNACAALRMTIRHLEDRNDAVSAALSRTGPLMVAELDRLLRMTDRMDLLFDELPPAEPQSLSSILAGVEDEFTRQFPFVGLEIEGTSDDDALLEYGNWVSWALLEVVVNAGEASGRGHPVQVAWRRGDTLELAVLNVGKGWDPQIPRDPPVPFYTTKGKHEGLGLAIAGRLCLAMGGTLTLVTDLPDVTAVKIAGVPARSV